MVIPTVAKAIEGAAPKSPAKLFGRRTSPSSAKALITAPPIRNLRTKSSIYHAARIIVRNSSSLGRLLRLLNQRLRLCDALASEQLVLLALELVVVDEEILQLAQELLWQIVQFANHRVHMIRIRDRHQPVVANPLLSIDLLSLDNANKPRGNQHARIRRLIHQQQHVDRIAVIRHGLGKKSEIIRKRHSRRQYLF